MESCIVCRRRPEWRIVFPNVRRRREAAARPPATSANTAQTRREVALLLPVKLERNAEWTHSQLRLKADATDIPRQIDNRRITKKALHAVLDDFDRAHNTLF